MPKLGLFITLYDEDTLNLYLDKGIYGFLMPPIYNKVSSRSRHYHALADYACIREGAHVFFFLKRRIIYGGQIIGSKEIGAFYLNGNYSPLAKKANAKLYWDESKRRKYQATSKEGVFIIPNVGERCQPYLIMFDDKIGIKGNAILSDQLYRELGKLQYPLPSNTISGMSFCTLTPGETEITLLLLKNKAKYKYLGKSSETISIKGEPIPFAPQHCVNNMQEALAKSFFVNEAHLEASVLANPKLLPTILQPNIDDVICRQVPMSPFKPYQMDRANICYYSKPLINNGTIPNTIIELKIKKVGKNGIEQVIRYLRWLYIILKGKASQIDIYLCGPSFSRTIENFIPEEYKHQIKLIKLLD